MDISFDAYVSLAHPTRPGLLAFVFPSVGLSIIDWCAAGQNSRRFQQRIFSYDQKRIHFYSRFCHRSVAIAAGGVDWEASTSCRRFKICRRDQRAAGQRKLLLLLLLLLLQYFSLHTLPRLPCISRSRIKDRAQWLLSGLEGKGETVRRKVSRKKEVATKKKKGARQQQSRQQQSRSTPRSAEARLADTTHYLQSEMWCLFVKVTMSAQAADGSGQRSGER